MEDFAPPPAPQPATAEQAALPWEDPGTGGLAGLFETITMFLTRPDEAFSRVSRAGLGRPFFYAVIMAWVELLFLLGYWTIFQFPLFAFGIPSLDEKLAEFAVGAGLMVFIAVGILVMTPFFVAMGIAIHTCIVHLMLLIVGEGKGGFDGTIRAICYAHTADLANALPAVRKSDLVGVVRGTPDRRPLQLPQMLLRQSRTRGLPSHIALLLLHDPRVLRCGHCRAGRLI